MVEQSVIMLKLVMQRNKINTDTGENGMRSAYSRYIGIALACTLIIVLFEWLLGFRALEWSAYRDVLVVVSAGVGVGALYSRYARKSSGTLIYLLEVIVLGVALLILARTLMGGIFSAAETNMLQIGFIVTALIMRRSPVNQPSEPVSE